MYNFLKNLLDFELLLGALLRAIFFCSVPLKYLY